MGIYLFLNVCCTTGDNFSLQYILVCLAKKKYACIDCWKPLSSLSLGLGMVIEVAMQKGETFDGMKEKLSQLLAFSPFTGYTVSLH